MKRVTLGGDRLGSGKKQKVDLHGFERSTHDLGYVWRNTQAPGTLVPFMTMLALPGDTFDIDLQADVKTHPTIGPLFASFKLQLDVFECPIRLYHAWLHNNKLAIGNDMSKVKLPQLELNGNALDFKPDPNGVFNTVPLEFQQINQSSLLAYLGIRGIGQSEPLDALTTKNAIPYLGFWDIYKNYYANKQEEIGAFIDINTRPFLWSDWKMRGDELHDFPRAYNNSYVVTPGTFYFTANYYGEEAPTMVYVYFTRPSEGDKWVRYVAVPVASATPITGGFAIETSNYTALETQNYRGIAEYMINDISEVTNDLRISTFDLSNIDDMRDLILRHATTDAFTIDSNSLTPYSSALKQFAFPSSLGHMAAIGTQQSLPLKTYQSDIFNNWLNTEWIDGTGGINEISAVSTAGGTFNIDALNLAQKVYNMLNRIAVSGGTYNDWLTAVYDHESFSRTETPMYHGGLSKEIIFQEVVGQAANNAAGEAGDENQPLGTLAGKGVLSNKHKGGKVTVKVNEPSYLIGIVSITPRIDYYQGNEFFTNHLTMNDLHKPNLDEIGFQELVTDKMAFWDTVIESGLPVFKSAGKQPAWIDYMTNFNKLYGNFADERSEMFMTLARRYEPDYVSDGTDNTIKDLTTYIDPTKFNYAFAQTDLTAQNFWVQIGVDCIARRKMSAKVMPNL